VPDAPCRHCLKLIERGQEELLLFTFDLFRELGEPPLPGPVYIHEKIVGVIREAVQLLKNAADDC
jgi:Protein of unknown function (DUF1203)